VRAAAATGVRSVAAIPLFLKPCSEKVFMPFLEKNFPQLVELYKSRFKNRAFLPAEYGRRVSALVKKFARKYRLGESPENSNHVRKNNASRQLQLFAR
jgi:hypothetical protein